MVRTMLGEVNKTKIIIVFFIVFSAMAAYAAVQLSKTMRPMTLEEYERYDGHTIAQPPTPFDIFVSYFIQ